MAETRTLERKGLTAATLATMAADQRARVLQLIPEAEAAGIDADWPFWARPEQRAPPGDWRVWLMLAGRGFGKTRAGAEWVRGWPKRMGAHASLWSARRSARRGR